VAGLRGYQEILGDPRARAFTSAGLVARMPLSMTGLGVVLLVSITTGSFAQAGLITAAGTLTGAITAPGWGRLIDRWGQARVLIIAAAINSASLTLLIVSVLRGWPLAVTLAAAVGSGLGFSSAGSCVRARWAHRLNGSPLLNTAYALEAVFDEVVFIVGPVLVTLLATSVHPALGLAVCVLLGAVGAAALASMRDTQPPLAAGPVRSRAVEPLPLGRLGPVALASVALGAVFGAMEVVVVAFARDADILRLSGFLLMAWAFGSLLAGVITGTITWRISGARRFRIAAAFLAASLLPLPFLELPILMAGLLVLSGFAIAPTLIASVAVTQAAVPPSRLTEALNWSSTGLATGLAAGAAGAGALIDSFGPTAGFWGVVGAGGLLVTAALFVRSGPAHPQRPEAPGLDGAATDTAAAVVSPGLSGTPAAAPPRRAVETPPR
jgi:MFS family permease